MKATKIVFALGFVVLLGACSSSKSTDGSPDEIPPPTTDAATDTLPQDNPEAPANTAQVDPAPAPSDAPAAPSVADATPPPADAAAPAPVADAAQAAPPAAAPDAAAPPAAPAPVVADNTPPSTPPAAPAASSGSGGTYTVQAGDTLMKIAFDTYGDLYRWKGILEANKDKIQDPSHIPPGVVLTLDQPATPVEIDRNGEKYMIKQGDTLGTISNEVYGTPGKWKKLWDNNKQLIHDPNRIFAGFYLYYVPEAGGQQKEVTPAPLSAAPAAPAPDAAAGADRSAASVPAAPPAVPAAQ